MKSKSIIAVSLLSLAIPALSFSQSFESQLQRVSKEIEAQQAETRARLAASKHEREKKAADKEDAQTIKIASDYLATHRNEFGLDLAAPLPRLKDAHSAFFMVHDAPPNYPYVPMGNIVSFEGQKYRGVDVIGTEIRIGVDPFKKTVAPKENSGKYYGNLSLAIQPTADFEAALTSVVGTKVYGPSCLGSCDISFTVAKEDIAQIRQPNRLVIIPPGKGPARLAWEVEVYVGGGGRKSIHRLWSM